MQRNNNNTITAKPEYVLKRANDLINTAYGNNADREKKLALDQLHNVISNKRKGNWTKIHEDLMKRHIELCVDLKDHRLVKDGLHQYRNLCQNIEPVSLEIVINHLIDLAEKRATEARNKADKVTLAAAAKVADLDQEESPESILLSSMTDEGNKHRTDIEVVVPWLKFLWEIYRAILELLHKNTKYDKLYHKTCEKAFKFCEEYKRNIEFRRLSEMLRMHLLNLQKLTITTNKANKAVFEWTSEVIDLHLHTRLIQLEVATTLELWNEAFRIVEDIYSIITIITASKRTPKAKVMAAYYEKLTRIFWVSENYLFHAYAWFKYYCLMTESRKDVKPEDKLYYATNVLLSALIIPNIKDVDFSTATISSDIDDTVIEKNQQMAMLLDFQSNPTRSNLLADIVNKNIHKEVYPELLNLYAYLESDFKPLTLPKDLRPMIDYLATKKNLFIYSIPIQHLAVLRVMQQLSKVYSIIKTDKVKQIFSELPNLTYNVVEKIMVDGVCHKQIHVRIDHVNQSLRFLSISSLVNIIETQVATLGSSLFKVANDIAEDLSDHNEIESAKQLEYFNDCNGASHEYYLKSLERKGRIDDLKQAIELSQQRKEEIDRIKREEVERQRLDIAKKQFLIDRDLREKQRQQLENLKNECESLQRDLEKYNFQIEIEELMKMDSIARQNLLSTAKSNYIKFKEEQHKKSIDQAKKLDYYVRAQRLESVKILEKLAEENAIIDRKIYEEKVKKIIENAKIEYEKNREEKKRLEKFQQYRPNFENKIIAIQKAMYDEYVANFKEESRQKRLFETVKRARYLHQKDLDKKRLDEEAERLRKAKDESDRIAKEQDEKLRKLRAEEEAKQRELESEDEKRHDRKPLIGQPENEPSNWRANRVPIPVTAPIITTNSLSEADSNQWRRVSTTTGKTESERIEEKTVTIESSSTPGPYRPPRPTFTANDKLSFGQEKQSFGSEKQSFSTDRPPSFGNSRLNSNSNSSVDNGQSKFNSSFSNKGSSDNNFGKSSVDKYDKKFTRIEGERGGFGDKFDKSRTDGERSGFGSSNSSFGNNSNAKPVDGDKWGPSPTAFSARRSGDNIRREPLVKSKDTTQTDSSDSWRKK